MNGEFGVPDAGLPPVFPSGLNLGELDLAGGAGFWDEVTRFTALATLDEVLDQAAGGKPVPRVWAVLDESENTAARTVAAMSLARTLSQRDQKVLVLDADDNHPDLTRWAGRSEQEGWIDCVRYGASLSSCCQPLPWEGRSANFMGIGSFWPTQVEPVEVEKLVSRLRRQVDDLIITAPLDAMGLVWARQSSVCLVCWDRLLRSTRDMEALVQRLVTAGIPVAGIVGFGLDEAEILDSVFQSSEERGADTFGALAADISAADASVTAAHEETPAEFERRQADTVASEATPANQDRPDSGEVPSRAVAGATDQAAGAAGVSAGSTEPAVAIPRRSNARQRTSPIFWAAAGLLTVVCAVIVILWVRMQDLPDTEVEPTLAQRSMDADISRSMQEPPGAAAAESLAYASLSPLTTAPDPAADSLPGEDEPGSVASTSQPVAAGKSKTSVEGGAADATVGAGKEGSDATGQQATQPPLPEPAAPAQQEATSSQALSPYSVPVGQAGWAIHLYSLPDEASTVGEAAKLERKGYRTAWRIEDVPGKGRYYRIYVGSFPSKTAARKALPELKDRLRVDWAQVRRF